MPDLTVSRLNETQTINRKTFFLAGISFTTLAEALGCTSGFLGVNLLQFLAYDLNTIDVSDAVTTGAIGSIVTLMFISYISLDYHQNTDCESNETPLNLLEYLAFIFGFGMSMGFTSTIAHLFVSQTFSLENPWIMFNIHFVGTTTLASLFFIGLSLMSVQPKDTLKNTKGHEESTKIVEKESTEKNDTQNNSFLMQYDLVDDDLGHEDMASLQHVYNIKPLLQSE